MVGKVRHRMVSLARSMVLKGNGNVLLNPSMLFDKIQLGPIIVDVRRALHINFKETWMPVLSAQLRSIVTERSSWMATWNAYNQPCPVPAIALVSYK